MSPIGDRNLPACYTARTAVAKARASQMLNPMSGLGADIGSGPHRNAQFSEARQDDGVYQFRTDHAVPFQYSLEAPRLNASLAAQLLGQMMPDPEQRNSGVLAAYEEVSMAAILCDRRL
jgi:hypothetical protein